MIVVQLYKTNNLQYHGKRRFNILQNNHVSGNISGLLCWNFEESGVDIAAELNAIVNQNIEGEEGKNGTKNFYLNFIEN